MTTAMMVRDWETYCEETNYSDKAVQLMTAAKEKLQAAQDCIGQALDKFCEAMDSIYEQDELSGFYKQMEEISDMLDDLNVATDMLRNQM